MRFFLGVEKSPKAHPLPSDSYPSRPWPDFFAAPDRIRGIDGAEDAVSPRQKDFLHEAARFDTARLVVRGSVVDPLR